MTNHDLEEKLVRLVRDVAPGPSMKEAVLKRLEAIPERGILSSSPWRRIRTHPIIRLTIAASILVTLTLSLLFWDQTSSMVLADVLSSVDKAGSFSLKIRTTRTGRRDGTYVAKATISKTFGTRMTEWKVDPNTQEMHLSTEMLFSILQDRFTMLSHEKKIAGSVKFSANDDASIADHFQGVDPCPMLLKILACEYQSIGFSKIDGKTVEGFQTTDPNYFSFRKPLGITATAWIDTETQLPVRIEETVNWVDGSQRCTVFDQYQWAIALDASDFEVTIPEHYASFNLDKVASILRWLGRWFWP